MWSVGFMPDQNAVIPLAHCCDAVGEGWETEVAEHSQKKVMHNWILIYLHFYMFQKERLKNK